MSKGARTGRTPPHAGRLAAAAALPPPPPPALLPTGAATGGGDHQRHHLRPPSPPTGNVPTTCQLPTTTTQDCYMVAGGLVRRGSVGAMEVREEDDDPMHAVKVVSFAKVTLGFGRAHTYTYALGLLAVRTATRGQPQCMTTATGITGWCSGRGSALAWHSWVAAGVGKSTRASGWCVARRRTDGLGCL